MPIAIFLTDEFIILLHTYIIKAHCKQGFVHPQMTLAVVDGATVHKKKIPLFACNFMFEARV